MIKVENLIYDYTDKRALNNVSFNIGEGAITALVGPNGSGKTTLLRSIAALTKPLSGNVVVNGFNAHTQPRELHLQIGYLQDLFGLYDSLTVIQSLQFMAHSRLQPGVDVDEAIALAIQRAGIADFQDKRVSALSRGMRQRVGIAQAIIHKPKVLLLDEPASGLDPAARYALSGLLIELRNSGMTILVSSHILAELEDYSTEILVIQDGLVLEHRQLKTTSTITSHVNIEIGFALSTDKYSDVIKAINGVVEINKFREKFHVKLDSAVLSKHLFLKQLIAQDMLVEDFAEVKVNLQDEYIKTVANYTQTKAK